MAEMLSRPILEAATKATLAPIGGNPGCFIAASSTVISGVLGSALGGALGGAVGLAVPLLAYWVFNMIRAGPLADAKTQRERADRAEALLKQGAETPIGARQSIADWPIAQLFRHLRPDLPVGITEAWRPTLQLVEDRFSTDQLEVWGRRVHVNASSTSLELIESDYWKNADMLGYCVNPNNARLTHTRRRSFDTPWEYRDLHVTKSACLAIWPEPLSPPVPPSDWKNGRCIYREPRVVLSEHLEEASEFNDKYIALFDLPPDAEIFYSIETQPKLSSWRFAVGHSRDILRKLENTSVERSVSLRDHMVHLYCQSSTGPPSLVVRVLVHYWRRAVDDTDETAVRQASEADGDGSAGSA